MRVGRPPSRTVLRLREGTRPQGRGDSGQKSHPRQGYGSCRPDRMPSSPSPRLIAAGVLCLGVALAAQSGPAERLGALPAVRLAPADDMSLGQVDSNSPMVWDMVNGRRVFFGLTSFAGVPSRFVGPGLGTDGVFRAGTPAPVTIDPVPAGGIWMEAVEADDGGAWYGFYHNELAAEACGENGKVAPRIGAARSTDRGRTWQDLGVVLEMAPWDLDCESRNKYFVGGVGDMSVMLDPEKQFLYMFYSQYGAGLDQQGVALARMVWANRDAPRGAWEVWADGAWLPTPGSPAEDGSTGSSLGTPLASPIYGAKVSIHRKNADVYWGPSVHYNTHLGRYVMLLNRTDDETFDQEGIYAGFADRLDDPSAWSPLVRVLQGGEWYPQVLGIERGVGTDKTAGQVARFFMAGKSAFTIEFEP